MIMVLLLVLLLLLMLNYFSITVITDEQQYNNSQYKMPQGNCGQTTYGCCPDGVNSKMGFNGNNCPKFNPGPGYRVR
jgi:hypothetical protein